MPRITYQVVVYHDDKSNSKYEFRSLDGAKEKATKLKADADMYGIVSIDIFSVTKERIAVYDCFD